MAPPGCDLSTGMLKYHFFALNDPGQNCWLVVQTVETRIVGGAAAEEAHVVAQLLCAFSSHLLILPKSALAREVSYLLFFGVGRTRCCCLADARG